MNTSLFELFKIGVGPSSSHTVGPMRAANHFVAELLAANPAAAIGRVTIDLYGSLALTGIGHGTDRAIIFGLMGEAPDTVDPSQMDEILRETRQSGQIRIHGEHPFPFQEGTDIRFHRGQMYPDPETPNHPNGLRLTAFDPQGGVLLTRVFYSVGGGFILTAEEFASASSARKRPVPYPFTSAADLLSMAGGNQLSIAELVLQNEIALLEDPSIRYRVSRILQQAALASHASVASPDEAVPRGDEATLRSAILVLWDVMNASITRGIATEGILPGGLSVRRRAPGLARRLAAMDEAGKPRDPLAPLDAVTLAAMAVNEENAAGGRVVTAPTNVVKQGSREDGSSIRISTQVLRSFMYRPISE